MRAGARFLGLEGAARCGRRDALAHVAACIDRDADELSTLLSRESGKPIKDARGEVARGALTFRTAAEEALRINGEWLPLDWSAANRGRHGIVRRYPIGPVAGISPFNFPLNLAAHKVAPAIAAGCSIVLKPPSKDPLSMLRIAEYLAGADLSSSGDWDVYVDWLMDRQTRLRAALAAVGGVPQPDEALIE